MSAIRQVAKQAGDRFKVELLFSDSSNVDCWCVIVAGKADAEVTGGSKEHGLVETQSAVGESSLVTSGSIADTSTTTTTSEATFDELTQEFSELKADDDKLSASVRQAPSQRESHSCWQILYW